MIMELSFWIILFGAILAWPLWTMRQDRKYRRERTRMRAKDAVKAAERILEEARPKR